VPHDYFDEPIASRYDETSADMFAPAEVEPAVDLLAELAGPDGSALEFAIGTGRIGLPLSARGVRVTGIDLSEAMVAQLRKKPGGQAIDVTIGDIASTALGATFDVVYLVFNTIMNLTSQDAQVAVFENAAAHLRAGGCFVVEVTVPQLHRLPVGERFVPFDVSDRHLGFDEYDVVNQGLVSHHYTKLDGQFEYEEWPFRYVWPAELDLMARIGGLKLRDRWSDWSRGPFTATSEKHVSVWEKPQ
jgi:methyltransferase family protein